MQIKIGLFLATVLVGSHVFAETHSQYDCTINLPPVRIGNTTAYNSKELYFTLKPSDTIGELEFKNPTSGQKQKAILKIPGDAMYLEFLGQVGTEWKSLHRVVLGGSVRSIMLSGSDNTNLSCTEKKAL